MKISTISSTDSDSSIAGVFKNQDFDWNKNYKNMAKSVIFPCDEIYVKSPSSISTHITSSRGGDGDGKHFPHSDQDPNPNQNNHNHSSSSFIFTPNFKIYFDFGYYLCIVPFRFKRDTNPNSNDSNPNRYIFHKNRFQQFACGLKHLFAFIRCVGNIRTSATKPRHPLVIFYFQVIQSMSMIPYLGTFFWTLWMSQDKIIQLINTTLHYSRYQTHDPSQNENTRQFSPLRINKAKILCLVPTIYSLISTIMGTGISQLATATQTQPISTIAQNYAETAKQNLFLSHPGQNNQSQTQNLNNEKNTEISISISQMILIMVNFLLEISLQSSDFFASMSLVLAAITLLDATKDFTKSLQKFGKLKPSSISSSSSTSTKKKNCNFDPDPDLESILDQFYDLKRYSEGINGFVAPTAFAYCFVSLSYFAVSLDDIVVKQDWFDKLYVIYFLINDGSIFIISARVCQEMGKFWWWLVERETRKVVAVEEMTVLLADVSSNPVGISGNGKFVIDNKFLGNMSITLITLFVIVLQDKV